eukprot:588576_1
MFAALAIVLGIYIGFCNGQFTDVQISFANFNACESCYTTVIDPTYSSNYHLYDHCNEGTADIHNTMNYNPIYVSPNVLASKCTDLENCNFTFGGGYAKGIVYISFDSVDDCLKCYPTIKNPGYNVTNLCGSTGSMATGSISITIIDKDIIDYIALTLESKSICAGVDRYKFT